MKRILISLVMILCCLAFARELRVLAIGNSFSASAVRSLPKVAASVPGCRLILTGAGIGGCSLERHWNEWCKAEKNPKHAPYGISFWDTADLAGKTNKSGNINELIKNKNNKYDIITIQQNSANSWKYDTYQPFADKLIAVLKKYQPQAEIVIQQTWSYRGDSRRLKSWKIDNTVMYNKLNEAYGKLAKAHGFRMIPTGYAVQIFRAKTPVKFVLPDFTSLEALKNPEQHAFDGEVVGYCRWAKSRKTKKYYLMTDMSHLNFHGEFMQGAVWFSFLFDQPATSVKYVPQGISAEQAKFLLECAQEAVSTFKQPGK